MTNFKKILIGGVITVVVGGLIVRNYRQTHRPVVYETTTVALANLTQTVDATGKIQSISSIDLKFEVSGVISSESVKEGQSVKTGALLGSLRLANLNAAVAEAEANLNAKLAGVTPQDIAYYKAAVDAAEAALQQVQNGSSLIVNQAYQDLATTIQASVSKLDDALTQADNILGIDNVSANADFKNVLSTLDVTKFGIAAGTYSVAKSENLNFRGKANVLSATSNASDIEVATVFGIQAMQDMIKLLNNVSEVLRATPPNGGLTQTTLDTKKSTIEAARTTLNTQYAALIDKHQAVETAKNTLAQKQAAYDQALANYQSKIVSPRAVDVASYRAAVAAAVANRDKAILRAPIDGVITKINKKVGETISSADAVMQLLSPHYEIDVDIPETDVAKVKVGDAAAITLDAFGDDVKFTGTVASIQPGSTRVQDVVYYKVIVNLADTDKAIKPDMTANISIKTASRDQSLTVPLRVVRTRDDGTKYVRVLDNGQAKEVTVTVGLRADEGKVEILSGLTVGEVVIISSSTAQ